MSITRENIDQAVSQIIPDRIEIVEGAELVQYVLSQIRVPSGMVVIGILPRSEADHEGKKVLRFYMHAGTYAHHGNALEAMRSHALAQQAGERIVAMLKELDVEKERRELVDHAYAAVLDSTDGAKQ